ncbi:MAG: InlB B-repeat-containing protein, partial [Clostridium sp.]
GAAWINNYYGGWAYNEGNYLATGWRNISGTWYYFNSYGLMQTGWLNDGGTWYYLDKSGAMQTGVIQVEGKIYLLGPNGGMQTGPAIVNGVMYYFGADGACIGDSVPTPLKGYDYYGNPVQPYVPSQISNPNASMDSVIPREPGDIAKTEYRIYYRDDDGEDIITKKIECDINSTNAYVTLYEPEKSGYEFIEWNTKKNGNGTSYDAGDRIKLTKDLTLYAQWDEIDDEDDDEDDDIKVTSIKVQAIGSTSITPTVVVGDKLQLTRKISPSNATNTKVTWTVKNKVNNTNGRAEIDSSGLLTALEAGTVTVRVTANDGSNVFKDINVIIEK